MDVTDLLARAVKAGASDVHLVAGQTPLWRLDGELQRLEHERLCDEALLRGLAPWLSEALRARWLSGDEVDLAIDCAAFGRARLSLFRQYHGLAASARLIAADVPTVEALALDDVYQEVSRCEGGLVLVGGATGSGKSSTLAALIAQLARDRGGHIITLEDPLEFLHRSGCGLITQREIGRHSQDFAQGLRSALRQDPDVIMIGELRDLDSIRLALRAAQTGHLVLATVHTRAAAGSIDRLVDVFAGEEKSLIRALLADCLQLVVAQALVRRVGGGRVAVREVLVASPAVRNLIREGRVAQLQSAMQAGAAQGMVTMEEARRRLQAGGVVLG